MHHYDEILSKIQRAETELNEAIRLANDNRGRGMDDDDARRIAKVRNAVSEQHEWFRRDFENRF